MKLPDASPGPLRPSSTQVELSLARVEGSRAFRGSARHRALLRYLVTQALADRAEVLKETVIAVEVFGRPAARFDPQTDSIVRVEARRLRARLASYYLDEGRESPIRIELPVGSYVPLLVSQADAPEHEAATRRSRDLVERGEHFLRQALSRQSLEQAIDRFDAALRESPDYAPACVGLARAWLNLATGWYREPRVAADHAAEALRRALVLQPGDATAHALLGAIQHQFEHDWTAAERSFQRAIALAPQAAFARSAYGYHLAARGSDAAERELALARQLDPQYINSRMHVVNLRIAQRRLVDAERELEGMRDLAPDTMAVVGMAGALAMFRGDAAAAIGHYRRACELMPDHPGVWCALAAAHGLAGDAEESARTMAQMHARFPERFVSPYMLAIVETRCGRADPAFALLRRCLDEHDPSAIFLAHDPSFDALRSDPRWAVLSAASTGRMRTPRAGTRATARTDGVKG